MRSIILAIIAVLAAVLLLCVGIFFRKDHSFRSQHIAENERMKEHHIHCATSQDREARHPSQNRIEVNDL
jgi:uncharacterized protein YneF (UPF0154 family)